MAGNDELDLERGEPAIAEKITASQKGGSERSRATRSSTAKRAPSKSAAQRVEDEIRSRLLRTFDRISDALASRGDTELSDVITEDKEAMTQGLVSLTRAVSWLRMPLLMLLNLVEPVLAFGRVARILFGRWVDRRARQQQEWEAAQQEQAATLANA
jgi:hypothetical protein